MSQLILHNYEISPFSEKTRLALGLKQLSWRSVRIPAVMPKPDVVALTGGYRRTPLLQVDNHVYCDTSLILRILDERAPDPPLFPRPEIASLCEWADTQLFRQVVTLTRRPTRLDSALRLLTQEELAKMRDDRAAMWEDIRLSSAAAATQLPAYVARLELQLANTPYLAGDEPTAADLAAYHCFWFLEHLLPETLEAHATLRAWMQRIAAIGHGESTEMSSEDALTVCRNASRPIGESTVSHPDIALGAEVTVRAVDYGREPVRGNLALFRDDEIAIHRRDERAGDVYVHFPRVGFEVRAQGA